MWKGLAILTLLSLFVLAASSNCSASECVSSEPDIEMCSYETHKQLRHLLKNLEKKYPKMAKVSYLGTSVQGRPIPVLQISRDVQRPRGLGVPMVKIVAAMHGNEATGRQLTIYLAQYLLNNYGKDKRVTRIVDNIDLHLVPILNPDGYAISKEGTCDGIVGRGNANDVDLNRDFPDQYDNVSPERYSTEEGLMMRRQQETKLMINFILNNPFVLSANLHTGAKVASYPFDSLPDDTSCAYSQSPDDVFFTLLASLYAQKHANMARDPPLCESYFPSGTTNGAHWYNVKGGMQDFNYVWSNCFEITLELTCCKHPKACCLPKEWDDNKEALLAFLESSQYGVKGRILDPSGNPVSDSKVQVQHNAKTVTATERGEYWRLLPPGKHRLRALTRNASGQVQATEFVQVEVKKSWPPQVIELNFEVGNQD